MSKLDYNYHSHTFRCGHACGSDEEYIQTAIQSGFKEYGVSDHIFLPGIIHENMRGQFSQLDDYVKSFTNLKEKYKDQINIHIGFEAEYIEEYKDYYKSLLENHTIDYLILGQHCYYKDGSSYPRWYGSMKGEKGMIRYTDHLIEGIKSGLFSYVAHPDLFSIFHGEWDELAISCSKKIIDTAIEYNLPLEINLCKVRARKYGYIQKDYLEIYPNINFWKLVAKTNAHIIVGVDTHNPQHNINSYIEYVDELIKETGIKVDFKYKLI